MILEKLKGNLIVSCQALEDEPLHSSFIMGRMALAAKEGGAAGIRANSKEDILEISKVVDLPIIGIIKRNYPDSEIYITPTKQEIDELLDTRCEIIAMDATMRQRPHNEKMEDLVHYIHKNGRLAMADCSTFEECKNAEEIGFDIISSTLCGYTPYSQKLEEPNFQLLKKCVDELNTPIIAEGKIHYPFHLRKVFEDCGVYSAVVGGAITRPKEITERFVESIKSIEL